VQAIENENNTVEKQREDSEEAQENEDAAKEDAPIQRTLITSPIFPTWIHVMNDEQIISKD
jgi:hypothetical protein